MKMKHEKIGSTKTTRRSRVTGSFMIRM